MFSDFSVFYAQKVVLHFRLMHSDLWTLGNGWDYVENTE